MFTDTLDPTELCRISSPYSDFPKQFLEQTGILCAHLAPKTQAILKKLKEGEYTRYQFTEIPVTEEMPPTPGAYPPPESSQAFQVEAVIGCLAQSLGKIFGYRENSDHLIYDIYPVRGYEKSSSFVNSRRMLGFHSDGSAHTRLIPDYTLLFCIRNDPLSVNLIADVDDVVRIIPTQVKETLFEPCFRHLVSQSPPSTLCKPVLFYENGRLSITYDDQNVSGTDKKSEEAIEFLNQAIAQSAMPVRNYTNSLLVLNNKRCVHARTPFTPRYNGEDRWIKGTYVSRTSIMNGTILTLES